MADNQTLIARAYAAFNRRDIDGALAVMSDSVSWPKASEGGRVVGKEEIRSYWTRQWDEFDPPRRTDRDHRRRAGQNRSQGSPTRQEPPRRRSFG